MSVIERRNDVIDEMIDLFGDNDLSQEENLKQIDKNISNINDVGKYPDSSAIVIKDNNYESAIEKLILHDKNEVGIKGLKNMYEDFLNNKKVYEAIKSGKLDKAFKNVDDREEFVKNHSMNDDMLDVFLLDYNGINVLPDDDSFMSYLDYRKIARVISEENSVIHYKDYYIFDN